MGTIKAVMLDYDGTLMDTNDIILESWRHTFRTVKGMEASPEEVYATFGEPLCDSMRKFFPGEDTERCVEIYREYQKDIYQKLIEMFPGTEEMVKELKTRGFKVAIVTSRLPNTTLQGVEKYNLTPYLDAIVTSADTDKHKPDPEPVLVCAEKLGIDPAEAIMVGDTGFDMICGRRAGARTALVGWSAACGDGRAAQLSGEAKPDYIINKAEELLQILEN